MTIQLSEVEHSSAYQLLKLSYEELDFLIKQAELALEKSQTLCYWLSGIKLEKQLREEGECS